MFKNEIEEILYSIYQNFTYNFDSMREQLQDYEFFNKHTGNVEVFISRLTSYILEQDDFGQKSIELKGVNGIYPLLQLSSTNFKNRIHSTTINLKEIKTNQLYGFGLGLCVKEYSEFPALLFMSLEDKEGEEPVFWLIP